MYRVIIKPAAEKQIVKLPKSVQRRVMEHLAALEINPRPQGCVKLSGATSTFRLRIGDYRIIYDIDDAHRTAIITIVAHRREVYRGI
jgi:mRNA interferase RelE/StbE